MAQLFDRGGVEVGHPSLLGVVLGGLGLGLLVYQVEFGGALASQRHEQCRGPAGAQHDGAGQPDRFQAHLVTLAAVTEREQQHGGHNRRHHQQATEDPPHTRRRQRPQPNVVIVNHEWAMQADMIESVSISYSVPPQVYLSRAVCNPRHSSKSASVHSF